jgi:hypothetical protein
LREVAKPPARFGPPGDRVAPRTMDTFWNPPADDDQ